jgi:23S rRNA (adenine2030-N6)-methyltransferase
MPEQPSDTGLVYDHRYHAGNHGDVWKHVALLSLLHHAREGETVVETHAGEGAYALGSTGEWTAGVGAVAASATREGATGSTGVDRWLSRLRRLSRGHDRFYPGSPMFSLDALPRDGRVILHEKSDQAVAALRRSVGGDNRARIVHGDGWRVQDVLPTTPTTLVIDPPFAAKDEWQTTTDVIASVVAKSKQTRVLLWYPVKRWARPNALHERLRAAGVPFVAIDLVVTPMEIERRALNGSGVLLIGAPESVVVELHAAAAVLGARMATHDGRWSMRTLATTVRP